MTYQKILTGSVARQVLFTSFSLSQGLPALQRDLFKYVAQRRPSWRLTEQMCSDLKALRVPIQAFFHTGLHIEPKISSIEQELINQIQVMQLMLEGTYDESVDSDDREEAEFMQLLTRIAQGFIVADYHYIKRPGGRVRLCQAPGRLKDDPHQDPFFSFFCYYVLLGNRLGVSVFDELFADLRSLFLQQDKALAIVMEDQQTREEFPKLLDRYNQMHPETPVFCSIHVHA